MTWQRKFNKWNFLYVLGIQLRHGSWIRGGSSWAVTHDEGLRGTAPLKSAFRIKIGRDEGQMLNDKVLYPNVGDYA